MGPTNRGMALTTRRRRMREDLPLRGRAPTPQPCAVAAVPQLAPHDPRPPGQRREAELRQEFLDGRTEKKVAERPVRIPLYGRRCFSELTLTRPGPVVDLVRPRNIPQLPVVLSPRDVRDLLAFGKNPTARRCRRLLDACGRRRREGSPLQSAAIDSPRRRVRVRPGHGGNDRDVPLAERTRPR